MIQRYRARRSRNIHATSTQHPARHPARCLAQNPHNCRAVANAMPTNLCAATCKTTRNVSRNGQCALGRPPTPKSLENLVLQLARENRSWGYKRIVGALDNVGHQVSRETVANILKRHGMAPAPERGKRMLWKDFIQSHLEVLAAVDFFTAEVWAAGGLTTYYVLVFMRIAPRQISLARKPDRPRPPRKEPTG